MAVKNSAAVKLNDATELVITTAPDGTVESCFNKSNSTEYVGGGGSSGALAFASVKINNTTGSSKSMGYVQKAGDAYAISKTESIGANATSTFTCVVNGIITAPSGATLTVVSGNFDAYDARHAVPLDADGGELNIS